MNVSKSILFLSFFIALSSCGGGSDDGAVTSKLQVNGSECALDQPIELRETEEGEPVNVRFVNLQTTPAVDWRGTSLENVNVKDAEFEVFTISGDLVAARINGAVMRRSSKLQASVGFSESSGFNGELVSKLDEAGDLTTYTLTLSTPKQDDIDGDVDGDDEIDIDFPSENDSKLKSESDVKVGANFDLNYFYNGEAITEFKFIQNVKTNRVEAMSLTYPVYLDGQFQENVSLCIKSASWK